MSTESVVNTDTPKLYNPVEKAVIYAAGVGVLNIALSPLLWDQLFGVALKTREDKTFKLNYFGWTLIIVLWILFVLASGVYCYYIANRLKFNQINDQSVGTAV